MYVLIEDGNITKHFQNPKGFTLNDNQYPASIFNKWSKEEKEAIGIYEVVIDSTNYKDTNYYINTNEQYSFANNVVTKSWGIATPKSLVDENVVDEDGNPILEDGVQVIDYGLKTEKKKIVKQQASGLLAPTDWHIVKATEVADYNVPANILSFRADVRSKSNEMETQIDSCTTVDELKALYEYTEQEDGTLKRPLAEFPKEVI